MKKKKFYSVIKPEQALLRSRLFAGLIRLTCRPSRQSVSLSDVLEVSLKF